MNDPIAIIKNIGKARIGTIAETAGKALSSISNLMALKISICFPGLEPETYSFGKKRFLSYLTGFLHDYGFENGAGKDKLEEFISISTRDDMLICVAGVKYLGDLLGYASAIVKETDKGGVPLHDGLFIIKSQVESRISSVLAPGSPSSLEIAGRRLLKDLHELEVRSVSVKPTPESRIIISLIRDDNKIDLVEADDFPVDDFESVQNGELLDGPSLDKLWPSIDKIKAGILVKDSQDRLFAFGFTDKKMITKATREKIYGRLEAITEVDIEHIIKSFEKLKNSFKKMVKSERAAAITETAVTVNHEINNPLTAILGNTQLLLMNKDKLPEETIVKLKTIEKSALKIRETTNKLMTIIDPVTTHYASGLEMIDIEKSRKKPPKK